MTLRMPQARMMVFGTLLEAIFVTDLTGRFVMADRYLRLPNPNPGEISDPMWWLMLEILRLESQARNGGIVARKPGYHASVDYNITLGKVFGANRNQWNYSIRDNVDLQGNRKIARGIDVVFADAQAGNYATIAKYSKRLRDSGRDPNDPRLDNWREFYGNTDLDDEVEGYDFRYERDVSSDVSHLWHVHGSVATRYADDWPTVDAWLSVWTGEPLQVWKDKNDMAADYGQYGPPSQKFVNDPMNRDQHPDIFAADVWGQEMYGQSPYNGQPSPRTKMLTATAADAAAAKALATLIDQKVSAPVPVTLNPEQYAALNRDIHAWIIEATTSAMGPMTDRLNLLLNALGRAGDDLGTLND